MKSILLSMFLILSFSCGKKNKHKDVPYMEPTQTNDNSPPLTDLSNTDSDADSDYDGVIDSVEITNGTDPSIAQIPQLLITDTSRVLIELTTDHKNRSHSRPYALKVDDSSKKGGLFPNLVNNNIVKNKSMTIVHNKIFGIKSTRDDFPAFNDLFKSNLGCIDQQSHVFNRFNKDRINEGQVLKAKLSFNYKYSFHNMDGISKVSNVISNASFRTDNRLDQYLLQLKPAKKIFNIENSKITEKMSFHNTYNTSAGLSSDDHCLYYAPESFNFKRVNKDFNFSDIKNTISKNNAQVLMIVDDNVSWTSINPDKYKNILDFIKLQNINIQLDKENNIVMLNDLHNEMSGEYILNSNSKEALARRQWHFTNTSEAEIKEKMKAGEIYIFSYVTGLDVLNVASEEVKVFDNNVNDSYNLSNLHVSDKVWIEGTFYSSLNKLPVESGFMSGQKKNCRGPRRHERNKGIQKCYRPEWVNKPNMCQYTIKSKTSKTWVTVDNAEVLRENLVLYVNGKKKNVKAIYGNTFGLYVKLSELDNFKGSLTFKIKNLSTHKYSYTRVRSEFNRSDTMICSNGARKYDVDTSVKKSYYLRMKVNRVGKIR